MTHRKETGELVYCGQIEQERIIPNCNFFVIIRDENGELFQCHEPLNLKTNPIAKGLPNLPPHVKNAECNCRDFRKADLKDQVITDNLQKVVTGIAPSTPLNVVSSTENLPWNLQRKKKTDTKEVE